MNSHFKFPRRVRIHGGECGAVARALHHKAQKDALTQNEQSLISDESPFLRQAGSGKASGSTFIERKQMSTKTTLKRIALVAVSALGFGVLSTVPAKAAFPATTSLTAGWSSVTVVDPDQTDGYGFFYFDSNNLAAADSAATTRARLVAGETIQVSVTGAPTGRAVTDLDIYSVTNSGAAINTDFADASNDTDGDSNITVTGAANNTHGNSNNTTSSTTVTGNELNRYWFAVGTDTAAAMGAGEYTLTVRLTNAEAQVLNYTVKVKFVETIADAGSVLTLAKTGSFSRSADGVSFARTANTNAQATLRDANGGRVQIGQAITGDRVGWDPTLTAAIVDADGISVNALTIADSGVTAVDHVACGTGGAAACSTTGTDSDNQVLNAAVNAAADGVYGVTGTITAAASTTTSLRVRISNTSVESTLAMSVVQVATGVGTHTDVLISGATGILPANTVYRDVAGTAGTNTLAYTLPTSVTAPSLTFDINSDATTAVAANQAYTSTVTWGSNVATANVTPASATAATNYTNADGRFTVSLTNTAPVAGASVTIVITGYATETHKVTVTLTWAAPVASTLTIVDPIASQYIKTGAATVFTAKVTDQFGNPVAGASIVPSITGTTSANYSATTTYAALTSDKDGMVSWSLAAGSVNDTTDTVKFTAASDSTVNASRTITYKTTLPAVSTMQNFYSDTFAAAASAITTSVPTAGIGSELAMVIARNLSFDLSANTNTAADDMIALKVRSLTSAGVAATGAAVTLTAGTGGHVLNLSGLPATSRTIAADSNGDVVFQIMATAPGAITFTISSGTATSTVTVNVVSAVPAASARTVAISGGTTGTANGEGVPMTVTVTDRYGNGASGVSLNVTASGTGALMGGATTASFTTDVNGKFTFLATSYASAGGAATFTASASNAGDSTSAAGKVSTSTVDSTLAAGKSSASATVTFAAGTNAAQAAAEAATDAAAEAIDAANAATDAANLAAEAADAATVAAEEARDAADAATAAVEELATQVATLMAALKAQITTLANTVAKIAKKVKA
jgi:hypothetical protein